MCAFSKQSFRGNVSFRTARALEVEEEEKLQKHANCGLTRSINGDDSCLYTYEHTHIRVRTHTQTPASLWRQTRLVMQNLTGGDGMTTRFLTRKEPSGKTREAIKQSRPGKKSPDKCQRNTLPRKLITRWQQQREKRKRATTVRVTKQILWPPSSLPAA